MKRPEDRAYNYASRVYDKVDGAFHYTGWDAKLKQFVFDNMVQAYMAGFRAGHQRGRKTAHAVDSREILRRAAAHNLSKRK